MFIFFNPPVHQCDVLHITDMLRVTLRNQSHQDLSENSRCPPPPPPWVFSLCFLTSCCLRFAATLILHCYGFKNSSPRMVVYLSSVDSKWRIFFTISWIYVPVRFNNSWRLGKKDSKTWLTTTVCCLFSPKLTVSIRVCNRLTVEHSVVWEHQNFLC